MKTNIQILLAILCLSGVPNLRAEDTKPATGATHEHSTKNGPTGGKLLKEVTPHVEFLVTKDKKVELRFIDQDNKVVAPGEQQITIILGDRLAPTKLAFIKDGDKLISDKAVPEGNDLPVVVQIREKADAKPVNVKFALNLDKCPSCAFQEYNCSCDH